MSARSKHMHEPSPENTGELLHHQTRLQSDSPAYISAAASPAAAPYPTSSTVHAHENLTGDHGSITYSSSSQHSSMEPWADSAASRYPSSSSLRYSREPPPPSSAAQSRPSSALPAGGYSGSSAISPASETASTGPHSTSRGSPAVSSSFEQVRYESGRSSLASTEHQSRSSRRGSRSPEPGNTGLSSTVPTAESSSQTTTRQRRRPKAQVASACWKCKRDHLSCDVERPCKRCVNSGQEEYCIDVPPKKRGRPKLDQRIEHDPNVIANRKRQRHTYFEIDPATVASEAYPRPPHPPPSSYHYQPAPASEPPGGRGPPSHYSSNPTTASTSSVYSYDSRAPSSVHSRDSVESRRSHPPPTTSESTASSGHPPLPTHVYRPHGQLSPNAPSPAAYNLDNLAASLPPTSPSLGPQGFGFPPGPHYRLHNPTNPQNFGTRPQRRVPASPFPLTPSREHLRPPTPGALPPVSPLQIQQRQGGFPPQPQLPALQPPFQLDTPNPSNSLGRGPSSLSDASSVSYPPAESSVRSSRTHSKNGRYDPVQEASRQREQCQGQSFREERTHGSRRSSDQASSRSGNESGASNTRKHRRALKLSDIVH